MTANALIASGFVLYRDGNPPTKIVSATVKAKLTGASFSEGSPDQQGTLVPDAGGAADSVWNFLADKDQNVGISCLYSNTDVMLSKPLPVLTASCTVTNAGTVTCH